MTDADRSDGHSAHFEHSPIFTSLYRVRALELDRGNGVS